MSDAIFTVAIDYITCSKRLTHGELHSILSECFTTSCVMFESICGYDYNNKVGELPLICLNSDNLKDEYYGLYKMYLENVDTLFEYMLQTVKDNKK